VAVRRASLSRCAQHVKLILLQRVDVALPCCID
jgi:hypothetical protein